MFEDFSNNQDWKFYRRYRLRSFELDPNSIGTRLVWRKATLPEGCCFHYGGGTITATMAIIDLFKLSYSQFKKYRPSIMIQGTNTHLDNYRCNYCRVFIKEEFGKDYGYLLSNVRGHYTFVVKMTDLNIYILEHNTDFISLKTQNCQWVRSLKLAKVQGWIRFVSCYCLSIVEIEDHSTVGYRDSIDRSNNRDLLSFLNSKELISRSRHQNYAAWGEWHPQLQRERLFEKNVLFLVVILYLDKSKTGLLATHQYVYLGCAFTFFHGNFFLAVPRMICPQKQKRRDLALILSAPDWKRNSPVAMDFIPHQIWVYIKF